MNNKQQPIPNSQGYFTNGYVHSSNPAPPKPGEVVQNEPPSPTKADMSRIKSYVTAEMSLHLEGPVPKEVFDERAKQCRACPELYATDKDEIGFCKACGCGMNPRARLTVKLTMPKSTCPKSKWGESRGRHERLVDRVRSAVINVLIPRVRK